MMLSTASLRTVPLRLSIEKPPNLRVIKIVMIRRWGVTLKELVRGFHERVRTGSIHRLSRLGPIFPRTQSA
jgi:hypothetical protein